MSIKPSLRSGRQLRHSSRNHSFRSVAWCTIFTLLAETSYFPQGALRKILLSLRCVKNIISNLAKGILEKWSTLATKYIWIPCQLHNHDHQPEKPPITNFQSTLLIFEENSSRWCRLVLPWPPGTPGATDNVIIKIKNPKNPRWRIFNRLYLRFEESSWR